MCSRFASHNIVMFNRIGISDMVKLVNARMKQTCRQIKKNTGIDVTYDERIALLLIMHFGKMDVRVVTSQAEQFIKREIYELSRQISGSSEGKAIRSIYLSIDDNRISDKAEKFFDLTEEARIVVVCDEYARTKIKNLPKNIEVLYCDSVDELVKVDFDEVTAFLIDPYFGMRKSEENILGLDDYDSEGIAIIKELLNKEVSGALYLLENGKKISETDKTTFYLKGVEDTLALTGDNAAESIREIVDKVALQKKCTRLINRRKIFDFESLQGISGKEGKAEIKFYDIVLKDAVNPEDTNYLIKIEERPKTRFADVIGAENAKDELKDFVKYLEDPRAYIKKVLSVPKGILLYGPPGTGKTMLARAMAGETDATFISISAADLKNGGADGVENVKRLFSTARKYAPSIIFIDEVDTVAKKRTGGITSSEYSETVLNMLLTEMDGFSQNPESPVFVIAATNFGVNASDNPMEGSLDPAFLRRFGNTILIDLPNNEERTIFLKKRLSIEGNKIKNSVTETGIKSLADRTPGESLATLENILELAYRNAARKGIELDDYELNEAMEDFFYGEERTQEDEKQKKATAVHEASHAYIYYLSGKKPSYLTIISRGQFLGYMQQEDDESLGSSSKEDFLWRIRTSLAGRVGEKVFYGENSLNTGASSDLKNASRIALNMLISYGMCDDHLFSMSIERLMNSPMLSEYIKTAEEILAQQEKICTELIMEGKDKIATLADKLLENSHLNSEEIDAILKR